MTTGWEHGKWPWPLPPLAHSLSRYTVSSWCGRALPYVLDEHHQTTWSVPALVGPKGRTDKDKYGQIVKGTWRGQARRGGGQGMQAETVVEDKGGAVGDPLGVKVMT